MGVKGPVDTKIDKNAVSELIVFANQHKNAIAEDAEVIRTLCRQMEEEESLKGGDGEAIRAAFHTIADGCNKLEASTTYISTKLNEKLAVMIQMGKGATTASATETAQKVNKQIGVFKE